MPISDPRRCRSAARLALVFACATTVIGCAADRSEPLSAPLVAAPSPAIAAPLDPGFIGVVIAGDAADLAPKAEGRIEELSVRVGDQVRAGASLARLDVRAAAHELASARAALAEASRRFSRRQALSRLDRDSITDEELDSARRALVQERERVATLAEAVGEAELRAPFEGTVAETYLSAGALAGPGRPVVRLVRPGEPRVRFAIPEERRAAVAVGDRVSVRVGPSAVPLPARVSGLAPEVDTASRLIYAAAALDPRTTVGAASEALTTGLIARVFPAAALAAPGERKPEAR